MSLTDNEKPGSDGEDAAQQELARRLDEMARLLRRMIVLAELSACGGMDVDRQVLQNAFERHRAEVKRLAGGIGL